jgi:hypothetical protein
VFEDFRKEQEEMKKEFDKAVKELNIPSIPFDDENGEVLDEQFDKEDMMDKIQEAQLLIKEYKKRCRAIAAVERRKQRAASRCDKNVWIALPHSVYMQFEEEIVPLLKAMLQETRSDFGVTHALRHLVYFALKHPGKIKAVTFDDLKEDE